MNRYAIQVDETISTLVTDGDYEKLTKGYIIEARNEILDYIEGHPEFETSFYPVYVTKSAGPIIKRMSEASLKIDVGPMASVAGAIAQYVVEELVNTGVRHVIFDNGGDIAMHLQEPAVIGIYRGPIGAQNLGFRISTMNKLLGICTSSGTVGHSFSFGVSDAAIVQSQDVTLADAVATALGNRISAEEPGTIASALNETMIEGIDGLMVIIGNLVGSTGNLPDIVKAKVDYSLISKGGRDENC
ncbi:MAG: UPF0280 family protein [Candidatus Thorarchaeota archaeon]